MIIFLIHLAGNSYICWHSWRLLQPRGWGRFLFWFFAGFLALSYPLPRIVSGVFPVFVSCFFTRVGAWWFGFTWYLVLMFFLADLWRLFGSRLFFRFGLNPKRGRAIFVFLLLGIALVIWMGKQNAQRILVTRIEEEIPGCPEGRSEFRLGVVSDIHLGMMDGEKTLLEICRLLKKLKPDCVVLLGDTIDRHRLGVEMDKYLEPLRSLDPPFGVYAVLGNHEYLSGVENSLKFFDRAGIKVLRDQAVLVADSIWLVGRDDWSCSWAGGDQKPLSELIGQLPSCCPAVVLDHQPLGRRVREAAVTGADLQLSGHIHAGQLSPFEWIVRIFFPYIYGRYQIEGMPLWVTSGAGCWGPPVRLGNHPEVMLVTLKMTSNRRVSRVSSWVRKLDE